MVMYERRLESDLWIVWRELRGALQCPYRCVLFTQHRMTDCQDAEHVGVFRVNFELAFGERDGVLIRN